MMFRYLLIIAALLAGVYVAVHARLISRPVFLEAVIDDVETEIKKEEGKASPPAPVEEAGPASTPAPAAVAEPAPSVAPEKAAEPAVASPAPAPAQKAAQGRRAPSAKKSRRAH